MTGLDFATNEDDVTEYKWDEAIHKDISDRPHLDYTGTLVLCIDFSARESFS